MNILTNGYIELEPKSLSPESELMATFATKNSNGIILAGLSRGLEKRRRRQAHLASTENEHILAWFCHLYFKISCQISVTVICKKKKEKERERERERKSDQFRKPELREGRRTKCTQIVAGWRCMDLLAENSCRARAVFKQTNKKTYTGNKHWKLLSTFVSQNYFLKHLQWTKNLYLAGCSRAPRIQGQSVSRNANLPLSTSFF